MLKNSLPSKTKIAAWWVIISQAIILLFLLLHILSIISPNKNFQIQKLDSSIFYLVFLFLLSGMSLIGGIYLLKGKKWAWIVSLGFLILQVWIPYFWPPLILLLIDRDNFFSFVKSSREENVKYKAKNFLKKNISSIQFASVWTIAIGIIAIIFNLFLSKNNKPSISFYVYTLLWGFAIIFSVLILRKKKIAWCLEQLTIVTILIFIILPLFQCFKEKSDIGRRECFYQSIDILLPVIIAVLIPFLIFFFDRKDFFKTAK